MESENNSVTLTNAITFAFMAKHLLPKSKVESLNAILRRVLTEEISPKEMMKDISTIVEDDQTVNMVWRTLIDRKGIRMSPLYNEISQLVEKFLESGVPLPNIYSFLYTVIYSAQHGMKNVDLIKTILSFSSLIKYKNITIPFLISYGLQISSRIEQIKEPKNKPEIERIQDILLPEKPDKKPLLPSLHVKPDENFNKQIESEQQQSISASASQQEHESTEEEEETDEFLSYSYVRSEFYITDHPKVLIMNNYAKSTMNGAEGAQDEKMSQFERYLNYIKCYAHYVFENYVKADISYFALSRVNAKNYSIANNIIVTNVVNDLYDQEAQTILKYIEHTKDLSLIKERCAQKLYDYADHRYKVSMFTARFSDVFPIFDYETSKKFSELHSKTYFVFDPYKSHSSFIIGEIARLYLPKLDRFIKEIVTLFTCNENERSMAICNDALASALFYFTRTCQSIEGLLQSSPCGEMSLDAILESAIFDVESKYDNVIRTEAASTIMSFVQRFFRGSEEYQVFQLFQEVLVRFGGKSTLFFRMIANLVKLRTIVERVLVDRNYKRFRRTAEFLGRCEGKNAQERLAARIPLMKQYIEPHFLGKLILIEMNGLTKEITITPSI